MLRRCILRGLLNRCCCAGVLIGIILSLAVFHACRYMPRQCIAVQPTAQETSAFGTQNAALRESGARNNLLIALTLFSCHPEELEVILNMWGRDVPSRSIHFYSCCEKRLNLLPRQDLMHSRLECSSGETPSLLSVINHLQHNHSHNSQWYLLASSYTYINYDLLTKFLNHLDPDRLLYLGKPMGANSSESYCEGGPGIVVSRALLNSLDTSECTQAVQEDACLGQLIRERHHISCWEGINKVGVTNK